MTRKTLGIRASTEESPSGARAWAPTGARLDRLKERARDLRRNPTEAQLRLWEELSGSRLGGVKFTRQAIVGSVIVAFACPSRWIVVEITRPDDNAELAALQDRKLSETGIRVLRFTEAEVLDGIDEVVKAINTAINAPFDRKAAMRAAAASRHAPTNSPEPEWSEG